MSVIFKKKPFPKTSSLIHTTILKALTPEIIFTGEIWKDEPSYLKKIQPTQMEKAISQLKSMTNIL